MEMELKHWTIFGLLQSDFVSTIKSAIVFGNLGHEALIITKNDEVYGLGSNSAGCLGYEGPSTLVPIKVEALCNKGIKGFGYGAGPHVIAYTEEGTVWAFGHNGFCQLGLGNSCQTVVPSIVNLAGKKAIEVVCGTHHTMALTADGEVYAWGQNSSGQVGCGSTANQPTPRRVSTVIGNTKIVSIACGQTSSFGVSENGEVFAWGYNGNSQLGIANTVNQYNPTKVLLPSVFIVKVVCGAAHTLALSDDGCLYSWGANNYGQLGIGPGHKSNILSPVKVSSEGIGRIIDIAATHYGHISACETHTKVFMWGQCRGQSVVSPVETNFKNIDDVFAFYSTPPVTYRLLRLEKYDNSSIIDALKLAFDDPTTSDIQFNVEDKTIYAHKAILRIRSEHFRCMFQGKWEENTEAVLTIDETVRFSVFRAFLHYLYTDRIDLPSEDAVDLLKLANYYCETNLRSQCEILIKQSITIDNAARLYSSAIQYNAKDLEEFTFQYMLHHLTAVIKSESFAELDGDLIKNLMVELANQNAFRY